MSLKQVEELLDNCSMKELEYIEQLVQDMIVRAKVNEGRYDDEEERKRRREPRFETKMLGNALSFLPVTEGEHLLGYLDTALVRRIDRENWDSTHVGDIFIAADASNMVTPSTPAETLLRTIAETGRRKFLVTTDHRLLGVVTLTDLLAYLAVLQESQPPSLSYPDNMPLRIPDLSHFRTEVTENSSHLFLFCFACYRIVNAGHCNKQ